MRWAVVSLPGMHKMSQFKEHNVSCGTTGKAVNTNFSMIICVKMLLSDFRPGGHVHECNNELLPQIVTAVLGNAGHVARTPGGVVMQSSALSWNRAQTGLSRTWRWRLNSAERE
jgi:hypothetical protein